MLNKTLFLYIILLPLMNVPKPHFLGNKIQYADIVFVPAFIFFIISVVRGRLKLTLDRIYLFLSLVCIIAMLSFLNSPFKQEAFLDTFGFFYLSCLFLVFSSVYNKAEDFFRVNLLIFAVTFFTSIFGIIVSLLYNVCQPEILLRFVYEKVQGAQSSFVPFSRTSSFLTLPEMFINFILFGLTSAFLLENSYRNNRRRKIVIFAIIVIILSAFLALSRSLVGILLFLSLLSFGFKRKGRIYTFIRFLTLALFIVLFLSAITIWFITIYPVSINIDSASKMINLSFNGNFDTRFYLAKAAILMGRHSPLLGWGLGTFTEHFGEFLSREDLGVLSGIRQTEPEMLKIDPHSVYFGTIAELGYLGFVCLIVFLFLILFKIKNSYKGKNAGPGFNFSCYVFYSAICAFLLNGYFVDILSMRSFWVLLGLGVAAPNMREKADNR